MVYQKFQYSYMICDLTSYLNYRLNFLDNSFDLLYSRPHLDQKFPFRETSGKFIKIGEVYELSWEDYNIEYYA